MYVYRDINISKIEKLTLSILLLLLLLIVLVVSSTTGLA